MGAAGWGAVGGALEGLVGVRVVNGWAGWEGLRGGALETADLAGTELAVVAAPLLPRSAATLTALDARWRRAGGHRGACSRTCLPPSSLRSSCLSPTSCPPPA